MKEVRRRTRREEYSEATRRALLAAARRQFSEHGYQAASIEAIARTARVTRGALYHHFADKQALFDAVVVELQAGVAEAVAAAAAGQGDQLMRLEAGIDAFLAAAVAPAYRRIVLQDGLAALGPLRYCEIEESHAHFLLTAALRALHRAGRIDIANVDLLARLIRAMVSEAAVQLADGGNTEELASDARQVFRRILAGLSTGPGGG